MRIRGEDIKYIEKHIDIRELKYYKDNPRVYSSVHAIHDFEEMPEKKQQEEIFKKLSKEQSVRNLIPDIKYHKGLIEPIVVLRDTYEVVEGNSRLAAYQILRDRNRNDNNWNLIYCKIVDRLSDEQLSAYLGEIHVKGKTRWTPYEQYNFARLKKKNGYSVKTISEWLGESESKTRNRIKVIELMDESKDNTQSHLSYYEVLVKTPKAYSAVKSGKLNQVLNEIITIPPDKDEEEHPSSKKVGFTAQDLRDALPNLLRKPKVLRLYEDGKINFTEAAERSKISAVKSKIEKVTSALASIDKEEVGRLSTNDFNALDQSAKKMRRAYNRVMKIIEDVRNSQ